ncbi:hypothetical protein MGAST_18400 [Mycobacterium gastri 'Wayne']|nr:hypothetical protein MGAST_18400 [Mycobacterium gastri 'Wayne']
MKLPVVTGNGVRSDWSGYETRHAQSVAALRTAGAR